MKKPVKKKTTAKKPAKKPLGKTAKESLKPVHATILLDETGSMLAHKATTISGFNEYLTTLLQKKAKVALTLVTFNSEKRTTHFRAKDIKDAPKLTEKNYQPNHSTPLYDAVGLTIQETENRKEAQSHDNLFIIFTDGEENCSREFTREGVFELITECKKAGWTFVFLGADQNAYAYGHKIGVHATNMMDYRGNQNIGTAFAAASHGTIAYSANLARAGGQTMDSFFDDAEKEKKAEEGS